MLNLSIYIHSRTQLQLGNRVLLPMWTKLGHSLEPQGLTIASNDTDSKVISIIDQIV